jgi:hypothetical protein
MAAAVLAGCLAAALASGDEVSHLDLSPRPEPPTKAEVDAAIERALARERRPGPPAAPESAAAGTKQRERTATAGKRAGRRSLLPRNRVVSFYGLPGGFGVLGRRSAEGARKKLRMQARGYRARGRPAIRAFDMVATVARSCRSRRDKCRTRVPRSLVRSYLQEVRKFNGRLLLDIQPARSSFIKELEYWRRFLLKPAVGLAIDPEWNVGRHGRPGETVGSSTAKQVNKLSRRLRHMIREHKLPPKLLVVHQFRGGSIRHEGDIRRRVRVDVTLNFDGIGAPSPKRRGYRQLAERRLFNGFSLFYKLDTDLMSPKQVRRLRPRVLYAMYQ